MKEKITGIVILSAVLLLFPGCSVIEGIFKAGVGVGVFVVVIILAIVAFIVSKIIGKK